MGHRLGRGNDCFCHPSERQSDKGLDSVRALYRGDDFLGVAIPPLLYRLTLEAKDLAGISFSEIRRTSFVSRVD